MGRCITQASIGSRRWRADFREHQRDTDAVTYTEMLCCVAKQHVLGAEDRQISGELAPSVEVVG